MKHDGISYNHHVNLYVLHIVLLSVLCLTFVLLNLVRFQEMLARSKGLEDGLIALCGEKSLLECELNKMHSGSGKRCL